MQDSPFYRCLAVAGCQGGNQIVNDPNDPDLYILPNIRINGQEIVALINSMIVCPNFYFLGGEAARGRLDSS